MLKIENQKLIFAKHNPETAHSPLTGNRILLPSVSGTIISTRENSI
jgi:hypothetical protein